MLAMTPKTCKDCGNPTFGSYPENRCQGCHEDAIRRDTRKQFEKSLGGLWAWLISSDRRK